MKTAILSLFLLLVSSSVFAHTYAIYDDNGVWGPSARHTRKLLKRMGHRVITLGHRSILSGRLERGDIDVLVMPGGKSWDFLSDLGEPGAKQIRNFVAHGGGYIGLCAGAFYAISDRIGGHTTGPYGIGLLKGTAIDPYRLGIPGFPRGMISVQFTLKDFKDWYRVLFLEGPIIEFSEEEARLKNLQVIARYKNGGVAGAIFNYELGRVLIIGPHPEVEEKRNFLMRFMYRDPDSEWPLLVPLVNFAATGIRPTLK